MMMPQWCCVKASGTIHLGAKTSGRTTIMANWATMYIFATKQRTMRNKMEKYQTKIMTVYLQRNMERIQKQCK